MQGAKRTERQAITFAVRSVLSQLVHMQAVVVAQQARAVHRFIQSENRLQAKCSVTVYIENTLLVPVAHGGL